MRSRRGYVCGGTHICVGVAGDMCTCAGNMYNGGTHIRVTAAQEFISDVIPGPGAPFVPVHVCIDYCSHNSVLRLKSAV